MKKLITLLFLILIPVLTVAQVNIVRTGGTGYFLQTAQGDTLQLRGSTPFYNSYHTAYVDAIEYSSSNGITVNVRSNIEDRVTADSFYYDETIIIEEVTDTVTVIETVTDTVFVDRVETIYETIRDTVYLDRVVRDTVTVTEYVDRIETVTDTLYVTEYDTTIINRVETITDTLYVDRVDTVIVEPERDLVEGFMGTVEYRPQDSLSVIHSKMYTSADSLHIVWDCDTERDPLTRIKYVSQGQREIIYDTIGTRCNTDLIVQYNFFSGGELAYTMQEFYPLWAINNSLPRSSYSNDFQVAEYTQWNQTWGYLESSIEGGFLVLDLPQRSIARLQWDLVPEHRNIRYTIKETIHASHSTGVHAGGRHSPADSLKHSVETYINGSGLGVSIFSENRWSNPHNFPFTWEVGEVVQYTVEIIDDTMRAKIWREGEEEPTEWMEYTDPLIGRVPAGKFAVGSTGAGIYPIHSIELEILD